MSFWKGIAQAIQEEDQQRFQSKEAEKAREARQWEIKEQRAYEQEMFTKQVTARRQDALAEIMARQHAAGKATEEQRDAQSWAMDYFKGVEGGEEIVAAAIARPSQALKLYNTFLEVSEKYAMERRGPVEPSVFAGALKVQGFEGFTSESVMSYEDIFNSGDRYADPTNFYEDMGKITGSSSPSGQRIEYDYSLSTGEPEELFKDQAELFEKAVDQKLQSIFAKFSKGEISEWKGMPQTAFRAIYDRSGPSAFYDNLGYEVASDLKGNETFVRGAEGNPIIGKFFKDRNEQETPGMPALPDTTDLSLSDTGSPNIPNDMSTLFVLPEDIKVAGRDMKTGDLEITPELIQAKAVPYEEWRNMSRTERKEAGLKVSELGGQIYYANRDGAYDLLPPNVLETLKRFFERSDKTDLEKLEDRPDREISTPIFYDDRNTTAKEKIQKALDLGFLEPGDWIIINGVPDQILE